MRPHRLTAYMMMIRWVVMMIRWVVMMIRWVAMMINSAVASLVVD